MKCHTSLESKVELLKSYVNEKKSFTDSDLTEDFQRVSITGENTNIMHLKDSSKASKLLVQALKIREKYMQTSNQTFPETTTRFLSSINQSDDTFTQFVSTKKHDDRKTIEGLLCFISHRDDLNS